MKTLICAAIMSLGLAGPALALSCSPTDFQDRFKWAAEETARYVVVYGTFEERHEPPGYIGSDGMMKDPTFTTRFTGHVGTKNGFTKPISTRVTVKRECGLGYCSGTITGRPVIAFLRKVGGGYAFSAAYCDRYLVRNPNGRDLRAAERCLANQSRCKD